MAKKAEKKPKQEMQVEIELDVDCAARTAKTILMAFDCRPATDALSVLNGVTIALASMVQSAKKCCRESEPDALEKEVLSWLKATDTITKLHFSKYITGIE
jgi:hypothetical protein